MNFIVIFENHRSKLISDFVSDPYGPLNFLEDIFGKIILVLGGVSSDAGSQRAPMILSRFLFPPLSPSSSSKKNERADSVSFRQSDL